MKLRQFFDVVTNEQTALLATSASGRVTMRTVSPVCYEKAILIFTHRDSLKYRQLKENPRCCLAVGTFFVETEAEFFGPTMTESNAPLRQAYAQKFPDAFDEGVEFGGRDAEFILLKPCRVSGWTFENGIPTAPFECLIHPTAQEEGTK